MTIQAEVIADSITHSPDFKGGYTSPNYHRITTVALKYPRFIHAELMTHRVFSRNASSSRAIPVERMIEFIKEDTAMPIHWGKNQPGMQAREEHDAPIGLPWFSHEEQSEHPETGDLFLTRYHELTGVDREHAWLEARDRAIEVALAFHKAGYHKQIVNRLLEPFSHINVLVTATDWDNFFELRDHPDAQPEIRALAQAIKKAMDDSVPENKRRGEWHMPYIDLQTYMDAAYYLRSSTDLEPGSSEIQRLCLKVSAARCARVSYKTFDGKPSTVEKDLKLFDQLAAGRPLHASPLEHQAAPAAGPYEWVNPVSNTYMTSDDDVRMNQRNFSGWVQHRAFWEKSIEKGEARA
jgi:thymidylate synthase ThyX